jgi:alpha-tubulin suppressor-like RCC1 family protein
MWGNNDFGQLGNDSTDGKNYPEELTGGSDKWLWLDVGYAHAGAVRLDGSAWFWGLNDSGQLGDNNIVNQSSPIQALLSGKTWNSVLCGKKFSGALELPATATPLYTAYSTFTPTPNPTATTPDPTPTPT